MSGEIMRKLKNALAINVSLLNECESSIDSVLRAKRYGRLSAKQVTQISKIVDRRKTLTQQNTYLTEAISELESIRAV